MGFCIAAEAVQRGHGVILVTGPVTLPEPDAVEVINVVSAAEMFEASKSRFLECDGAIMTAAVGDYRPARRLRRKLKKRNRARTIELKPTEDICAFLGRIKGTRILVGFAMEDRDHHENAESKLYGKQCDAIVLNRLDALGAKIAEVEILRADTGWSPRFSGTKAQIATAILDVLESLAARKDQYRVS